MSTKKQPPAASKPPAENPEKPDISGHPDGPGDDEVDQVQGLDARQLQAIEALLQHPTLARAASAVGIHERTLRRWLRLPQFKAAVSEARREAFGQATGLMQWYASVAVTALVKILNDTAASSSARVAAAGMVLKLGREGIELDDLAQRLAALEQASGVDPPAKPLEEQSMKAMVKRVSLLEGQALRLRSSVPDPIPLESPADVLAVLEEQVNAVRADEWAEPVDKARTLGLLASIALRAMEGRDLAARLEAVERVLKLRRDEERQDKKQHRG